MTPKEKATQLIDTFYQTTPNEAWYNPPLGSISMEYKAWEQAKQCALITVNEMKEAIREVCDEEILAIHMIYWEKVKQEINK